MGPIFDRVDALLEAAGHPIVAVGDVVTYHLTSAGHDPKIAIVDGLTERGAVDPSIEAGVPDSGATVTVENPQSTVTAALIEAIETALDRNGTTTIDVEGEEDLAVLPALFLAPEGATIVYGQPGEGMVAVIVDEESREMARDRLAAMEYDESVWAELIEGSA